MQLVKKTLDINKREIRLLLGYIGSGHKQCTTQKALEGEWCKAFFFKKKTHQKDLWLYENPYEKSRKLIKL